MATLAGKWRITLKSPMGNTEAEWDIKEEGGVYTGTLTTGGKTTEWKELNVTGDSFEGKIALDLPFGLTEFHYTGDFTDTEISGISKMKMGKAKYKGKRI